MKQSSVNLDITPNADGFDISGGTTPRKITLSGGDVAIAGTGSAVITFPSSNSTLATLALSEALTNKSVNGVTLVDGGSSTLYLSEDGTYSTPAGGYTNLTQFVAQTAWRVFYSDGSGDVTELALGASGTFLKSNGASSAPTFDTPAGSGDVTKVGTPVDNQVGVWTGSGTLEGTTGLTFDGNIFTVTGTSNNTAFFTSSNTVGVSMVLNATSGGYAYEFYSTGSGNSQGGGWFGVYDQTTSKTNFGIKFPDFRLAGSTLFGWDTNANYGGNGTLDVGFKKTTTGELEVTTGAGTRGVIYALGRAYNAGTWAASDRLTTEDSVHDVFVTLAPLTSPTFATSITGSYLTASEILITDGSKNIVSAPVATYPSLTELTYVKGVTSAIQTQMNLKAPLASPTFTGTVILPKTLEIQDTSADHQYVLAVSELAADRTITLPLLTGNDEFVFKDHAQTLTNKTLTTPAITTATLSGAQTLAEGASIHLDSVLSADGTWSGNTMPGVAGYTQAFGDLVYLDPTDSRWELVDANSAAGADGDARGMICMVVVAGTDGNACTLLLPGSTIRADAKFPSFTVNNPIYASETAGSVTQTQPATTDAVIRVVGFALTADSMFFNPSPDYITRV